MAGYQQVIIVGNVGRDPELKYLQSGVPVCNFTVAVNSVFGQGEQRQEKTTWFRVAAWRELGETCNKFLTKGKQVMVIGTVDARAYTDGSGQPQATLELTARDVRFLGSREGGGEGGSFEGGSGGGNFDDNSGGNFDQIPF
ncbi:MAG: single-stranded DNA-binding protein [Anaerolineae bacterium]|nr:single-stranded DNA-binding protein [Anaerolineae bacterium]